MPAFALEDQGELHQRRPLPTCCQTKEASDLVETPQDRGECVAFVGFEMFGRFMAVGDGQEGVMTRIDGSE